MNASDETPEVNDQATPEDGQAAPVGGKVKDFFKKNGPKILVVGGAVLAVWAALTLHPDDEQAPTRLARSTRRFPPPSPSPPQTRRRSAEVRSCIRSGGR